MNYHADCIYLSEREHANFMFYMLSFWQIFWIQRFFPFVWWNTLENYGQRLTMNGTQMSVTFSCQATAWATWSITCHATHALTWLPHAVLKPHPWTGSQVTKVLGETNKQTETNWQVNWVLAEQQAFPTGSSLADTAHYLSTLF